MGRDGEKKTVRQRFLGWGNRRSVFILEWLLPVLAVIFIFGAAWRLYLAGHRDYERIAFVLMPTAGGMLTIWVAQGRFIEQQEREDKRQDARLESEAKMHNERLRVESEREHERLRVEAQKDRDQRSITQRIDLAEKLASAIEHLSSENELQQAAGVQEILFQIDDWYALIETEIVGIMEGGGDGKNRKSSTLWLESLRHRQELFDIAYKFETKNVELLKTRARGLNQRLVKDREHSLLGLDLSGIVIGWTKPAGKTSFRIGLKEVNAKYFIMSNSEMRYVDLSEAYLEGANLLGAHLQGVHLQSALLRGARLVDAHLEGANLLGSHLEGANLSGAHLEGADLTIARLQRAYLQGAHLEGANLLYAGLQRAYLQGVHLEGANLSGAHLEGANLSGAHLEGARLSYAHLQGTDLTNVFFYKTALQDKNLLDRAEYDGKTKFPDWLNPEEYGMQLVDETGDES